ncbi:MULTISPECIES: hypothetical protein [Rhizobium]|nr:MULTISPECIES: hypothetical protein [Rhizobium]
MNLSLLFFEWLETPLSMWSSFFALVVAGVVWSSLKTQDQQQRA